MTSAFVSVYLHEDCPKCGRLGSDYNRLKLLDYGPDLWQLFCSSCHHKVRDVNEADMAVIESALKSELRMLTKEFAAMRATKGGKYVQA